MTDDLVARLRAYDGRVWETTACYNGLREVAAASIEAAEARVRELEEELAELEHGVSDLVEEADYHSGMRAAAEARVRELDAELADQQTIAKYNREQAEAAGRAALEDEK